MLHILLICKLDIEGCIAANRIVYEVYGKQPTPSHKITILIGDRVRKIERERETKIMLEFERDLFLDYVSLLETVEPKTSEVDAIWPRCLTFTQMAKKYGIHVEEIKNANDEATVAKVAEMKPDVILNLRNTMIYKAPIISVPRLGFLNCHSGPLPHYKGLFGVLQQMRFGETEIGCALHQVDTGIDTGAVLTKRFIKLHPDKSVLWHQLMLYLESCEYFISLFPQFEKGIHVKDMGEVQDANVGEYFGVPSSEELQDFYKKGFKIIIPQEMDELTAKYFSPIDTVVGKLQNFLINDTAEISEILTTPLRNLMTHQETAMVQA